MRGTCLWLISCYLVLAWSWLFWIVFVVLHVFFLRSVAPRDLQRCGQIIIVTRWCCLLQTCHTPRQSSGLHCWSIGRKVVLHLGHWHRILYTISNWSWRMAPWTSIPCRQLNCRGPRHGCRIFCPGRVLASQWASVSRMWSFEFSTFSPLRSRQRLFGGSGCVFGRSRSCLWLLVQCHSART